MTVAESTGTETAGRVIDVLLLFTDGPATLGVTRIARELDLSKAVVHRILQTLVGKGMLVPDPASRGYRLGPAAAMLGARAVQDSGLRTAAIGLMHELRDTTGETATVTALVPNGRIYLDQVESNHEIKMTIELRRRFPLHAGSSGKCMLAFLPQERREQILGLGLSELTPRTPTDPSELRAELDVIRRRGYAISDGERQHDAASVAAPVLGHGEVVLGAISVCGPSYRVTTEVVDAIAPRVVTAAQRVSRVMSADGAEPDVAQPIAAR